MEQKINIAELLKDCPKGMELDCVLYENLYFDYVREHPIYPIVCYTIDNKGEKISVSFTWYGKHIPVNTAKCVIFPKGKTTWEGFHRPFELGDIVINDNHEHAFIYSGENDQFWECYCGVYCGTRDICINSKQWSDKRQELRLATEEEKEKLFQVIRDNGYYWNSETKTLKKIIQSKFKVGDKVRRKNNHNLVFTITSIEEDSYGCGANLVLWFDDQDKYELIPNKFDITTLKPFDKVLVRDHNRAYWDITFYECYDKTNKSYPYRALGGTVYKQCIPYKDNEDLVGFVKECSDYYKTWINEENEFN